MKEKRNKIDITTRITPCEICNIYFSDRHHLLNFAKYGENLHTIQLCPTCHALLHIAFNSIIFKKKRSTLIWNAFVEAMDENNNYIKKIIDKVYEMGEVIFELEIKHQSDL